MTSTAIVAILSYGHILSAMGWLGGGILTTFVVAPNLRKLPSAAALEFNAKVLPRLLRFVQMMIGSTFLFGILLFYYIFNGSFSSLSSTSEGMELYLGIFIALMTAVLVWTVTLPSFKRVIKISSELLQGGQQAPPPDLAKYGNRARMGSTVAILLLLVVLATMVSVGVGAY